MMISERRAQFITPFTPPEGGVEHAAHPTLYRAGWFGLILCLLGLLTGKALQNVGMVLLLAATIGEYRALIPMMKRDPLFHVTAAFLLYLAVQTSFAHYEFPGTGQIPVAIGICRIALIFIFAFWIRGTVKTGILIYIMTLIGLFLALLFRIDWRHLGALFSGESDVLGIHRSSMALIFATAFIGLLIFGKTIWGASAAKGYRTRIGLWVLVTTFFFQWILLTRVRIVWIGLISWMVCALIFLAVRYFRESVGEVIIRKTAIFVSVVLIGMGIVFTQWDTISAHLLQEKTVVQKVLKRDFKDMPATSFGSRTYLWKIGWEAAKERTLFGWGPSSTPILIQRGNIPESIKREVSNLHNGYLEIFVRFGLIGFILIGMIMFLLVRAAFKMAKESPLHAQIALFSLSAFFLFGIANMTDMHLRPVGWYFFAIIGGVVYSFSLYGGSPTGIGQARHPLGPDKEVG